MGKMSSPQCVLSSSSKVGQVCSHGDRALRENRKDIRSLGSELARRHFYHILLAKVNTSPAHIQGGEKIDSIPW